MRRSLLAGAFAAALSFFAGLSFAETRCETLAWKIPAVEKAKKTAFLAEDRAKATSELPWLQAEWELKKCPAELEKKKATCERLNKELKESLADQAKSA